MKPPLLITVLILAACVGPQVGEKPPLDPAVFGFLETRHGTITLLRTTDGPRYTVVDSAGRTIAFEVDEAYLAQHLPEFHRLVDPHVITEPLGIGDLGYVEERR